jgi:hypothetical protein
MRRCIAAAIILLAFSEASAGFLTYAQWEALNPESRMLYIAGATDSIVNISGPFGEMRVAKHIQSCLSSSRLTASQLAENIRILASARPELQKGSVQLVLVQYLTQLCGPPPD